MLTYVKIKPVCNQIELHPYNAQLDLVKFLIDFEIVPVAYCPVARPSASEKPANSEVQESYSSCPDLRNEPIID